MIRLAMIRLALIAAALLAAAAAHAQTFKTPGGTNVPGVVLMCANGITNADGSQQVVPCSQTQPVPHRTIGVQRTLPCPTLPTTAIPALGQPNAGLSAPAASGC